MLDSTPYGEIISAMSEAHGVDPLLVRALIQVESKYQPPCPVVARRDGADAADATDGSRVQPSESLDPKSNIEAGIKRLKSLIDKWGVELALAAYNAGEGAVTRFNGVPPIARLAVTFPGFWRSRAFSRPRHQTSSAVSGPGPASSPPLRSKLC